MVNGIANNNPYTAYSSYGLGPNNTAGHAAASANAMPGIDGKDGREQDGRINGQSSPEECQTCKERKYKDGSNENVSFKSASHISPEAAGAAVRAHENEHVANAFSNAAKDDGKVLRASVTIKTDICPECGRTFVSGGRTNTMIKYSDESNPYQKNQKSLDAAKFVGKHINYAA